VRVVARKGGKGKPKPEGKEEELQEGKEGIFIVDDEHVWWDAVGARREEEERKS
jgi:hypothetical protein